MEKNNRITPRPRNVGAPVVHGSPSSVHSPRFPDCGESALQPHVPASSRAVTNVMLEHAKTLASVITAAYPKNKASPVPRSRAFSLNPPRRGIRQIFEIQEDREGQRWTLICRLSLGFGRCSRTRPLLLPNGPGNKWALALRRRFRWRRTASGRFWVSMPRKGAFKALGQLPCFHRTGLPAAFEGL